MEWTCLICCVTIENSVDLYTPFIFCGFVSGFASFALNGHDAIRECTSMRCPIVMARKSRRRKDPATSHYALIKHVLALARRNLGMLAGPPRGRWPVYALDLAAPHLHLSLVCFEMCGKSNGCCRNKMRLSLRYVGIPTRTAGSGLCHGRTYDGRIVSRSSVFRIQRQPYLSYISKRSSSFREGPIQK
jgi:hypothetical protein